MLIAQKRYLYPVYLLTNWILAVLFCVASFMACRWCAQAPASHPFFSQLACGLIFYYLIPIFLLFSFASKKIWFGDHFHSIHSTYLKYFPPLMAATIMLIFSIYGMPAFGLSYTTVASTIENSHLIVLASGYAVSLAILLMGRWGLSLFITKSNTRSHLIQSVVIIGTGRRAKKAARNIRNCPHCGMRIVGFLSNTPNDIGNYVESYSIIKPAIKYTTFFCNASFKPAILGIYEK